MDPAAAGKPRLPIIRRSSEIKLPPREKRYVFDKAYDGNTDNRTLYNGAVKASFSLLFWQFMKCGRGLWLSVRIAQTCAACKAAVSSFTADVYMMTVSSNGYMHTSLDSRPVRLSGAI